MQIFYHEYVLNTFVESLGKSEITLPLVKAVIEALGLEEAFSYLPFAENLTSMEYGVYSGLKSEFKFKKDELYGQLSPIFVMKNDDGSVAYAFACTLIGDMNIYFDFKEDKTIMTGKIKSVEGKDFIFFPGTVKEIDVSDFTSRWNRFIIPIALRVVNAILEEGFSLGNIKLLEEYFKIDVDHLYLKAYDGYLELSLNINIDEAKTYLE